MQKIASGLLAYHPKSRRILLGLRSDTNSWCNFGGGFEPGKDATIKDGAIREFGEETCCESDYSISYSPIDIFESNFIRYYTYEAIFPNLFQPKLNNEHRDYGWFKLDNLPSNIMPECLSTINKAKNRLENISSTACV